MARSWKIIIGIVVLSALVAGFLYLRGNDKTFAAVPGDIVELNFELEKDYPFGEYFFDLENGKSSTWPLCFCLVEKNTYPPDCTGDVKYIYNNTPGTMCMPLHIGKGRCTTRVMSSSGHATMFIIPLEYAWTKPVEKIVIGVKVPGSAPNGARIAVGVNIFKRNNAGQLVAYRQYEQAIKVGRKR